MSDQFLAEIRIFPFNFAPYGWAFCNGAILPISQYSALFSLLGTNFGGNGTTNFGLPNLPGTVPLHAAGGAGPGLSNYVVGEATGTSTVTLSLAQLANHGHTIKAAAVPANSKTPSATTPLARTSSGTGYLAPDNKVGPMNQAVISTVGGSGPHNNLMPYLTLNFCIAMTGIFPVRN